jgi:hypothetical protein
MATGSISYTGSRVTIHAFVGDIAGPGRVGVEQGANPSWAAIRLDDGHGMQFTLSGDRSSLRMLVAGVLAQLTPEPDPAAAAATEEAA